MLESVAFRNRTEHTDYDGSDNECYNDSLQEDGVLNLSESWLLNPHFTVEYFADNISLLVLHNPWLVFIAVTRTEAVKGTSFHIVI